MSQSRKWRFRRVTCNEDMQGIVLSPDVIMHGDRRSATMHPMQVPVDHTSDSCPFWNTMRQSTFGLGRM